MLTYALSHYQELLRALIEHVELSMTSLLIAFSIALPLGHTLSKYPRLSDTVIGLFSMLYSIPSLGLLALLIPFFGLGNVSAIIALVLYAQFILVRNTILGFRSVSPTLVEIGKGMGLNAFQLFSQVEFPLALPTILGGLRIATASTIGIASLAAWINAGGLGTVLFEGIYQNHIPKMLWGSLLIISLGLSLELMLLALQKSALSETHIKA